MVSSPFRETISLDADGHPVVAHLAGPPPGSAPILVASHGITANALSFARIATEIGSAATVVALDHRGRGESSSHPGPYGTEAHARDCVAALDRFGLERGVLVGHSMGAMVVARAAHEHAERTAAVVLIDGGLPVAIPDGVDPEHAVDAVVGPAVARLSLSWVSPEAVYDMWRAHPAMADWGGWHELYIDHDVEPGPGGDLRCRVREAAVRVDGADALVDQSVTRHIHQVAVPAWLLRAPRGILDDPTAPLLDPDVVAELRRDRPDIAVVEMPADVNHYNIMWGDSAVPIVVDTLRAALAAV